MGKIVNTRLLIRKDTQENWLRVNPILASGEIGFDTTVGKHKIGNGSDRWSILPYFSLQTDLNDKVTCIYRTTEEWEQLRSLVSEVGTIYIYTDYKTIEDGSDTKVIPGIKIGDGMAYVIDLPFATDIVGESFLDHIHDNVRHITQEEREFWNNKVTCYIDGYNIQNLVFDKDSTIYI